MKLIADKIHIGKYQIAYQYAHVPDHGVSYVLVHGIGVSSRYLLTLAEELADSADVYVIDLPGYGLSERPDRVLSISELATIVQGFMKLQNITQIYLVGQSMGCQIVVEAALQDNSNIDGLVLIGPVTNPRERTVHRQSLRLLQDMIRESIGTNLVVLRDYVRCGVRRYLATVPYMLGYKTEEKIRLVSQPILVIRGAHDPIASREWARELCEAAQHATYKEMEKGAHNVMHQHPKLVAETIRSWQG